MLFRRRKVKRPGLTTVRVTQGLLRAEVLKSKLESAGIPALLEYESIGPTLGITVDGLGEVQVMVPDELAAEAQALLEEQDWSEEEELDDLDDPGDTA
jgi:hypothetical protein